MPTVSSLELVELMISEQPRGEPAVWQECGAPVATSWVGNIIAGEKLTTTSANTDDHVSARLRVAELAPLAIES